MKPVKEVSVYKSVEVSRKTNAQVKNRCVFWSTGNDFAAMLVLIREVPRDAIHIDTGWRFKEVYEFGDKPAKE